VSTLAARANAEGALTERSARSARAARAPRAARTPSAADCWPDGTPRSLGNAFTLHLDGTRSIFNTALERQAAAASAVQSRTVERMRLKGIEPARAYGLSAKAETEKANRSHNNPRLLLPVWIGPNKPDYRHWLAIAPKAPADVDEPAQDEQEHTP
jgi:hypothetical protein